MEEEQKQEEIQTEGLNPMIPAHNTRKTTLPVIASPSNTNYVCKWRICD